MNLEKALWVVVTWVRMRRVTIALASHRGIVSGLGIYMDWINISIHQVASCDDDDD